MGLSAETPKKGQQPQKSEPQRIPPPARCIPLLFTPTTAPTSPTFFLLLSNSACSSALFSSSSVSPLSPSSSSSSSTSFSPSSSLSPSLPISSSESYPLFSPSSLSPSSRTLCYPSSFPAPSSSSSSRSESRSRSRSTCSACSSSRSASTVPCFVSVIHELLLPDFDLFWQTPSRTYPYFGNLPIKRADYMAVDARRIYLDDNTSLQKGLLKSFYMYVHFMPGVLDSWLRIQIWRPMELDKREKKYQLVWEHRVLVDIEAFPNGIVHQFVINSSRVPVTTGDLFGWTFEDEKYGPVGFDRYPSARTLYRTLPSRDFPRLGLVYQFEAEPLQAVFSVAVEVFDHDVCARCHTDLLPLKPQLTEEDDDVIPGGLVGNVSLDSDFTKSVDSPESAANDNDDVPLIVGCVLGGVALVLVVVNVAVYVKLRKMKKDDQEAAQRRESANRRKEARTIESRSVNPRSD